METVMTQEMGFKKTQRIDPREAKLSEIIEKGKTSLRKTLEEIQHEFTIREDMAVRPTAIDFLVQDHKIRPVIRKKGYEPLRVIERFKRAGMEDEYRSMYNLVSTEAHSNISPLISRHLEIDAGAFGVIYYKDEPVESFLPYIDTTNALLLDSGVIIHELLSSPALERVKTLREEFVKQRPIHLTTI